MPPPVFASAGADARWSASSREPEEGLDLAASITPMGRMPAPAGIAELAVYLASDDDRGMTGQALNLSAGGMMHGWA